MTIVNIPIQANNSYIYILHKYIGTYIILNKYNKIIVNFNDTIGFFIILQSGNVDNNCIITLSIEKLFLESDKTFKYLCLSKE